MSRSASQRQTWRIELVDSFSGTSVDVAVEADPSSTCQDFLDQLTNSGFDPGYAWVDGTSINREATLAEAGIVHGSKISNGRSSNPQGANPQGSSPQGYAPRTTQRAGYWFVVLTGPNTGLCVPIDSQTVSVGRSDTAHIALDDPQISRSHVEISTNEDYIALVDSGSKNGTFVKGLAIEAGEETRIDYNEFFSLGRTVVTVVRVNQADLLTPGDACGPNRTVQRKFREALKPLPTRLEAPVAADERVPPMMWWRALLPMFGGVGMALMSGRWEFLAFMALAPIVYAFDARRRSKATSRKQLEAAESLERELIRFSSELSAARSQEQLRNRTRAVGGAQAALTAKVGHRSLWERNPGDTDFGAVTVGYADIESEIDTGSYDAGLLTSMAIETSLLRTGSLGLLGTRRSTRGVIRSLVLSLATTHSPESLTISAILGDTVDEWSFLRWLPHCYSDDVLLVGATSQDRSMIWHNARLTLSSRREVDQGGVAFGTHLVVIEDSSLVDESELAELLAHGPAVGLVIIVADQHRVPEGARASLTVSTTEAESRFESVDKPLVSRLTVCPISSEIADEAARSIAGLRPAASSDVDPMGTEVALVDMLGIRDITPAGVAARWQSVSPQTSTTVGIATDVPIRIDIAEDGPHGLIGGMSGSGKTEFLMTMLTGLCLDNHPDDLAIVIVDFKGGVDHDLTSQFPHVISLSTNLRIEQFNRTIELLDAEQRRRQKLLAGVGGDLDAYRAARVSRPELPPLPRLVVIVDEFSELLASEDGKARLGELVRITRIGRALGVHLLLVTQNFEGQLPPQIEANAGLRVCLRVMDERHSKIVIGSGAAAKIDDRNAGRGFARLGGQDLIEFQTARVAGRRGHSSETGEGVLVEVSPWETRCRPRSKPRPTKPPAEHTDLHHLVRTLKEAAVLTGWTPQTVPWPEQLATDVALPDLLKPASEMVALGIEDIPEEQTQRPFGLASTTEQAIFVGTATSRATETALLHAVVSAYKASPSELHIHGIDLDGSGLNRLHSFPHTGTISTRVENLSLRLLRYLSETASQRRATLLASNSASIADYQEKTGNTFATELLIVTGAHRLTRRDSDTTDLIGPALQALINDGRGVGIKIIMTGEPQLIDHRLGSNADQHLYFSMPPQIRPTTYGVDSAQVIDLETPGRCVDSKSKHTVQTASLDPYDLVTIGKRMAEAGHRGSSPAKRLTDITWPFPIEATLDSLAARPPTNGGLPVGVNTESGEVETLDPAYEGNLFVVAGNPKTGRSTALVAAAQMARHQGWKTVAITNNPRSPLSNECSQSFDEVLPVDGLVTNSGNRRIAVFVDDYHRPGIQPDIGLLKSAADMIMVSGSIDFFDGRSKERKELPEVLQGLLLAPTGFNDGSIFGLRTRLSDQERADPKPGRGLLAIDGLLTPIQVPAPSEQAMGTAPHSPLARTAGN